MTKRYKFASIIRSRPSWEVLVSVLLKGDVLGLERMDAPSELRPLVLRLLCCDLARVLALRNTWNRCNDCYTILLLFQVRSFQPEDGETVREICRSHFRSLCVPAVKYYILEHFRDLVALLVIGKVFQTWTELLMAAIMFLIYLFIRARVEMVRNQTFVDTVAYWSFKTSFHRWSSL